MKFFVAFTLVVVVASAAVIKPSAIAEIQQISEIVAAIHSPSTDPATAVLLEQQLQDILGLYPGVGPAIIEDIPVLPVHPGVAVEPSPAVVQPSPTPTPSAGAPLVQLIVNVNAESAPGVQPIAINEPINIERPTPIAINEPDFVVVRPTPVAVVDEIVPAPVAPVVVDPVQIAEPALPVVVEPIQIAEPTLPVVVEPIQIAEPALPVVVDPIQIVEPTFPIPVAPVNLPDILN